MTAVSGRFMPWRMWIVARLLTAVVFALGKYFWRTPRFYKHKTSGDLAWVLREQRRKRSVIATWSGVPLRRPIEFAVTRQRAWDRFCTRLGLGRKLEVPDATINARLFIAGDHPVLELLLREDEEFRQTLMRLYTSGTRRLFSDGEYLWIWRRGSSRPSLDELRLLAKLRDHIESVPAEDYRALRDGPTIVARMIEAGAVGMLAYGVIWLFESVFRAWPLYFRWAPAVGCGAIGVLVLLTALAVAIRTGLKHSTRAHRVLVENFWVLLVGLPLFSTGAISDINVGLDDSSATRLEQTVIGNYTTISHEKHGTRTHYHLMLKTTARGRSLPDELEVPYWIFQRSPRGAQLIVLLHEGALGLPWVEDIYPEN